MMVSDVLMQGVMLENGITVSALGCLFAFQQAAAVCNARAESKAKHRALTASTFLSAIRLQCLPAVSTLAC